MCYPVKCLQCGKTTWQGCGQHVDQVKDQVPPTQWCSGHAHDPAPSGDVFGK